ncbi:hypothetical protein SS50377_27147 [Spironucleus salmonicida]|uniref:Uncharacterized protein n=1 Tax=Spironucleus salmonicida TaxID=348837 RepID=A0A9P8LM24_9EUKA|nr:hypothetical protein SS50377_27147 [Spironucleus salmonicida]
MVVRETSFWRRNSTQWKLHVWRDIGAASQEWLAFLRNSQYQWQPAANGDSAAHELHENQHGHGLEYQDDEDWDVAGRQVLRLDGDGGQGAREPGLVYGEVERGHWDGVAPEVLHAVAVQLPHEVMVCVGPVELQVVLVDVEGALGEPVAVAPRLECERGQEADLERERRERVEGQVEGQGLRVRVRRARQDLQAPAEHKQLPDAVGHNAGAGYAQGLRDGAEVDPGGCPDRVPGAHLGQQALVRGGAGPAALGAGKVRAGGVEGEVAHVPLLGQDRVRGAVYRSSRGGPEVQPHGRVRARDLTPHVLYDDDLVQEEGHVDALEDARQALLHERPEADVECLRRVGHPEHHLHRALGVQPRDHLRGLELQAGLGGAGQSRAVEGELLVDGAVKEGVGREEHAAIYVDRGQRVVERPEEGRVLHDDNRGNIVHKAATGPHLDQAHLVPELVAYLQGGEQDHLGLAPELEDQVHHVQRVAALDAEADHGAGAVDDVHDVRGEGGAGGGVEHQQGLLVDGEEAAGRVAAHGVADLDGLAEVRDEGVVHGDAGEEHSGVA